MSAETKITAAKVTIGLEHCFYGSLMGNLLFKSDTSHPTAYTNGVVLGYNPAFIETLNHDGVVAVVAHEIGHNALGHPYRRGGRDPKLYNIACDKALNGELAKEFKLPDWCVMPDPDEVGKSVEWIYARLADKQAQDNPPQPQPQPQPDPDTDEDGQEPTDEDGEGDAQEQPQPGDGDPLGEVQDAPTGSDDSGDPAPTKEDWEQLASEAMNHAQLQGSMSGGMARTVEASLEPQIDARSLLIRFFQESNAADYTWTRPAARYLASGLYLPKLHSNSLGEIAVINDTSCSRGNVAMDSARKIVQSVIDDCDPAAVTVYHADAQVAQVDRIERGDPIEWNVRGGGGTDFRPALQAIEDEGTAICAVYITDLEGTFPEVPPPFPVIWLSTEKHIAPFGETVYIEF